MIRFLIGMLLQLVMAAIALALRIAFALALLLGRLLALGLRAGWQAWRARRARRAVAPEPEVLAPPRPARSARSDFVPRPLRPRPRGRR
jgi:hypothetical protein